MANIKPLDSATDKWVRRASVAASDYQYGVINPRRDWLEAVKASEANYKAGVIAAANDGRYGRGASNAGTEKWRSNAQKKGPSRFAEGVAIAKDEWAKGFGPYHSAISSITLPPRGPKGSPQNIQRVTAIAQALRAIRERASK